MTMFPVRQYQPGGEFVVVREMDYGSRHFDAGDPFPWRAMGLHEATVQMLWKAVRIEVKRQPTAATVAVTATPATPPPAKPAAPPHQQQRNHGQNHRR